jgi:hypothetical protein
MWKVISNKLQGLLKSDNVDNSVVKLPWSQPVNKWITEITSRQQQPLLLLSFKKNYDWLRDRSIKLPEKLMELRKEVQDHESTYFIIFSYGKDKGYFDAVKRIEEIFENDNDRGYDSWENYWSSVIRDSKERRDAILDIVKDFLTSVFPVANMREIATSIDPKYERKLTEDQIKRDISEKFIGKVSSSENRLIRLMCEMISQREESRSILVEDRNFATFVKEHAKETAISEFRKRSAEDWEKFLDKSNEEKRLEIRAIITNILSEHFSVNEMKSELCLSSHIVTSITINSLHRPTVAYELYRIATEEGRLGALIHAMIQHGAKGGGVLKKLSEQEYFSIFYKDYRAADYIRELKNDHFESADEFSELKVNIAPLQNALIRCLSSGIFNVKQVCTLESEFLKTDSPDEIERAAIADAIWSLFESDYKELLWRIFRSETFQDLSKEKRLNIYREIAIAVQE